MLALSSVVLASCANTSGKGNEFVVTGTITTLGDQSITIDDVIVGEAFGEATDWFIDGAHQVHDNYRTCETLGYGRKTVGRVVVDGQSAGLDSLSPGDVVEVTGTIRESALQCGQRTRYEFRPVFDVVELTR